MRLFPAWDFIQILISVDPFTVCRHKPNNQQCRAKTNQNDCPHGLPVPCVLTASRAMRTGEPNYSRLAFRAMWAVVFNDVSSHANYAPTHGSLTPSLVLMFSSMSMSSGSPIHLSHSHRTTSTSSSSGPLVSHASNRSGIGSIIALPGLNLLRLSVPPCLPKIPGSTC